MLIPSKLVCSYRLQNSISRDRLIKILEKSTNSLSTSIVLVNAPAGYGKTTLVAQWLSTKQNVGWYSLDEGDNETDRFATYFSAAIHNALQLPQPEEQGQINLFTLINQLLVKTLNTKDPVYLVIDDYHLIENDEIHDALKYWIKHQPTNFTLVLITRFIPPLGIAHLRVQEQLLEIDAHQLSFNSQESLAFFQARLGESAVSEIQEQDIAILTNEVEGWATALQLISLTAKQDPKMLVPLLQQNAKRLARANHLHIYDYLSDEVLDKVGTETKQFLLRCSILRSMNERLVQAVTGDRFSHKKLEELSKQGLFLEQMAESDWWRFHPLFASFLQHCGEMELQDELQSLHQKAALCWLDLGFTTEALHHAILLEDNQILLDILEKNAWSLFHQGEFKLLERTLNTLSYEQLIHHSHIALLKAWLVQSQHRYEEVSGIFAKFSQALEQHQVKLSKEEEAEFNVLKAQVAINSGDWQTALSSASTALLHLPETAYYAHIVATSIIGEAYHCDGQFDDALIMLSQTEKMARQYHTHHNVLWALLQQSEILLSQGFLQSAYDKLEKANAFVKENHLQKVPMYEFLLRLKGKILWEWYELDKADAMAQAGMSVLPKPHEHLQCLALLARVSLVRGDLDNAARLLNDISQMQLHHNYHQDWQTNAEQAKIFYWQMTNNEQAAANWLAQYFEPDTDRNHFAQAQWCNIARAKILVKRYDEALAILNRIIHTAEQLRFVSELNHALILRNRLYFLTGEKVKAEADLMSALNLTKQTNFISAFVIEGEEMAQQIRCLLSENRLEEIVSHKAQFILRHINQYYRHKFAHFDEQFVEQLLNNPAMPELLKISPLTQREWQVLGLIYSGYSNEQISEELQVATTTIKTHIRNLYQKIGVANRQEAIEYTLGLLAIMGYK